MKIRTVTVILTTLFQACLCNVNNVCKTIEDYRTISYNPNCWYNPDVGASPSQIAKNHGYAFEEHRVVTDDGYVLTVFRVPHNGTNTAMKRRPVVLFHGLLVDGTVFMYLGKQSLAFFLSREGFDVWIPNIRGTRYSPGHLKYSLKDQRYWDFSFHENGVHDLPAVLDYVRGQTGGQKIALLPYSMGTTMSFIYASTRPKHAKKILSGIVSLAPVAFMNHSRSFAKPLSVFTEMLRQALLPISDYGFGPNTLLTVESIGRICSVYPAIVFCGVVAPVISGVNENNDVRPEDIPVIYTHLISGLSFKTLIHFGQILTSKAEFKAFDYGSGKNLEIYNSITPSHYNLSRISVPVHLFYGKNDYFSEEKDVMNLYNLLTVNKSVMSVFEDDGNHFSHVDFQCGKSSIKLFNLLLRYL